MAMPPLPLLLLLLLLWPPGSLAVFFRHFWMCCAVLERL
jgi:hypothetical protein